MGKRKEDDDKESADASSESFVESSVTHVPLICESFGSPVLQRLIDFRKRGISQVERRE